jgi:hypothetical protein
VTFDLGDFPASACEALGVEAHHPDDFLCDLFDLDPPGVVQVVEQHAADLTNPPLTVAELLQHFENAGVPRFADAVRVEAGL